MLMVRLGHADKYDCQAHNLKVAGSNPAPRNQSHQHFFNLSYVKKTFLTHVWHNQKGFCLQFQGAWLLIFATILILTPLNNPESHADYKVVVRMTIDT